MQLTICLYRLSSDEPNSRLDYVERVLCDRLRWPEDAADHAAWREHWRGAFRHRLGHIIRTSQALADALAALARRIRAAAEVLLAAESEKGPLTRLYRGFKDALIHDLTPEGFADTYAQTITYGLLTAAINRTDTAGGTGATYVKADDLTLMVRVTSPFLREMLQTFLTVGGRKHGLDFDELGIQDVIDLLRGDETDLPAILRDFGNRTRGEDPVIHFYEHFLKAYNKKLKVQRGVFYTPQPVVSYIVRSVHELLQTEFGLEHGLADTTTWEQFLQQSKIKNPQSEIKLPPLTDAHNETRTISPEEPFVQILDPATGTATFLVEVIDLIHKHLDAKWKERGLAAMPDLPAQAKISEPPKTFEAYWQHYVPHGLLPRLHGYELLAAPYAIAHLKLGLKLTETGYRFGSDERARVFLTNALEPWQKQLNLPDFDALAHEAAAVNEIKRGKRFTVVIGNPPYAGHSSNDGEWATQLVEPYYSVDGKPLGEKNPKWLQDDYVKFTAFGQKCVHRTGCGVHSYITNHGYIDNPTFRGMRQQLANLNDTISILDLHGNSTKKERSPDGSADDNVFDIKQGVAIFASLLLKNRQPSPAAIKHTHLFGSRKAKYVFLSKNSLSSTKVVSAFPASPFHLFVPQDLDLRGEYESHIPMTKVMPTNVLGFQTHRDHFAVDFDKDVLLKRIAEFRDMNLTDKQVADAWKIPDNRDWNVKDARRQLRRDTNWKKWLIRCSYRPFDTRPCYFSTVAMDYPRREMLDHVANRTNLCVGLGRQGIAVQDPVWSLISISKVPIDANIFRRGGINVFPLWLYPDQDGLSFSIERRLNFSDSFLKALAAALQLEQKAPHGLPTGLTPEAIFHYIYAVFHSPGYRTRYAEFLKIDFPRLPLPGSLDLFQNLAKLGGELVALHLLESPLLDTPRTEFVGGNRVVSKVTYTPDHGGTVWIDGGGTKNAPKPGSSGFRPVPENVWNFHIGGYQVCEKWLKDRKSRTLSSEDIAHYHKIIIALTETIRLMAEIDQVIEAHGGWPGAFKKEEKECVE